MSDQRSPRDYRPPPPPGSPQTPPGYPPPQPGSSQPRPSPVPPPTAPIPGAEGNRASARGAPGRPDAQSGIAAGIVLAGIGVLLLLGQSVPDMVRWIPLIVGLVFMAAFFLKREYGFLVPGSIITGVGVGILLVNLVSSGLEGSVMLLSIAAGFLAIWAIGALFRVPQNHWWPLIPGGILALVGVIQLADADVGSVVRWWPLILIVAGVLVIHRALVNARA